MTSQATFVRGSKGNYAIVDGIHMYVINRKEPLQNVQYWRCRKFLKHNREKSCQASIVMDMEGYIKSTSKVPHNHPPDPEGVQATIKEAKEYDPEQKEQKKREKIGKKAEMKEARKRKVSEDHDSDGSPKSPKQNRRKYATKKVKERAAIQLETVLAQQELQEGKSFREVAEMLGYTKTLEANLHKEYRPPTPPLPPKKKIKQTLRQQEAEDKKVGAGQNEVLARYVTQMSYDTSKQISASLKNLGIMDLTPGQVVGRLHTLGFERIIETNDITGKGVYRWIQSVPEKKDDSAAVRKAAEKICKTMKPLLPNPFPKGAPTSTAAGELPSRPSSLLAGLPILPQNPMHILLPQ